MLPGTISLTLLQQKLAMSATAVTAVLQELHIYLTHTFGTYSLRGFLLALLGPVGTREYNSFSEYKYRLNCSRYAAA